MPRTQIAMLQHPELNSKSADPIVGHARDQLLAYKDDARRRYLRVHAAEFALVMFSRQTSGYWRVQRPIVQRFQEEMSWQVTLRDLDQRPDLGEHFGVEVTTTTMVIRRNSQKRMVLAGGARPILTWLTWPTLPDGDIRPQQVMTGAGEENGSSTY